MARKTSKDFERFKKHFRRYQERFGLNGYKVYFNYEPIENAFADISADVHGMAATVRLNSRLPEKDKPHVNLMANAKHEALHLLVNRLENCGRLRYVRSEEIYEAVEEVVRKLEMLIPD